MSIVVAWLLLFAGVVHLFFGWHTRSAGAVIWKLLVGVAYLFAAFYMLNHPGRGLLTLTFVLAFYLFFEGIFEAAIYSRLRRLPGAGWFLFDAIVTIVLGIMIFMSWPVQFGVGGGHADRHQYFVQRDHAPELCLRHASRHHGNSHLADGLLRRFLRRSGNTDFPVVCDNKAETTQ